MTTVSQLQYSSPEAEGISSGAILAFVEAADAQLESMNSLMVLRHGKVVAEGWWTPYVADYPHMLFSLSKSFTSTGVGLAVAEGRLTVEDSVLSFFPEDAPAQPSEHLKSMRVKHLLSMNTGHKDDTTGAMRESADGNWAKAFLALPVEFEPSTHFLYNTGATYMLSAIVQKLTGMTLLDYLRPRLFEPLGIQNPTWETCPRGINTGGFGLSVTTADISKFGQLYLQKGEWESKRIVPQSWVEEATMAHSDNNNGTETNPDWTQGYGYQFWRCRHDAYRGDGAFGQYCIVMPKQDTVVAITSGVKDMQAVLNLVWDCLLPALTPAALPADPGARDALQHRLSHLSLAPVKGDTTSPVAAVVAGKTYTFPSNEQRIESVSLDFDDHCATLTFRDGRGENRLRVSHGAWLPGLSYFDRRGQQPVAVSGAWTAANTYVIKEIAVETPFVYTITLRFAGNEVAVDYAVNVTMGPAETPHWVGVTAAV